MHCRLNRRFDVSLVVAVKAFYTYRIIECTNEAILDSNILAVVHIDSVGVESPATDDLHIADIEIFTSNGTDVVYKRIAYSDTVDLDIVAVFKLNSV